MITIKKPTIRVSENKAIFECKLLINNKERILFYEVDKEYQKYLCTERSDAIVIATLHYAMKNNHNIKSEVPITRSLYHNIVTYLIPILSKNSNMLNKIEIDIPLADSIPNLGKVGTGMSCGIDSFHTLKNYLNIENEEMKLTHLCLNNVGSFNTYKEKYNGSGSQKARNNLIERSKKVADEVGLPLIITNSNVHKIFMDNYYRVHSFANMFSVFMLQKLFGIYYYSSAGFDPLHFSVTDTFFLDSAEYELLIFYVFSTKNLKIYSEGMEKSRLEKTIDIADYDLAQKHLHVCCSDGDNCGTCKKCRRTILALDSIGKLDNFKNIFDISYYRKNKKEYIDWLNSQVLENDYINTNTSKLLRQKQGETEYKDIQKFNNLNIIIPENDIKSIIIKKENEIILSKNSNSKYKTNLVRKLEICNKLLKHTDKKFLLPKRYLNNKLINGKTLKSIVNYLIKTILNKKITITSNELITYLLFSNYSNKKIDTHFNRCSTN